MSQKFNIAVLGAESIVGTAMVEVLEERDFPIDTLFLLGSEENEGESQKFKNRSVAQTNVADFDWSQVHLALFATDEQTALEWAPTAADFGVVVIDSSGAFNQQYDIPLVVPEVNPETLAEYRNQNIIAVPTSNVTEMLVALKPIYDAVGIERINVSTYQSVSGSGKAGIDELAGQTAKLLNGLPAENSAYDKQIAFNCLPQTGGLLDNGYTREEMELVLGAQKVLADESVTVNPTCVRIPVFYGDGMSLHIETAQPSSAEEITSILEQAEGVILFPNGDYPTAVGDVTGSSDVMIARVREDISHVSGINLWLVADNVRKGIAINTVKTAEVLVRDYL
ncbi:aspartate-semialdehyde dehydrogenase [Vibrio sp. SS-MA-C1-2]|uniref:aspartate-semialdehyde dehydrogenase n=1 Tax=Vibrio sp. SS-MA-C1-2 TaxID=2908646 RepID=UPI001F40C1B5|nr:aspartate-semialdehyde dehydrogenase [Vibrio sp. SS-MA-C1-2]UJF18780.1 aspartate-semialdehyde dehydrogenase [Vibrio sp. SS-MA-C1-2]